MYCKHCGKEIADDSQYCRYCGTNLVEEKNDFNNADDAKGTATIIVQDTDNNIKAPKLDSDLEQNVNSHSTVSNQMPNDDTDEIAIANEEKSNFKKVLAFVSGAILFALIGAALIALLAVVIVLLYALLPRILAITIIILLLICFGVFIYDCVSSYLKHKRK